MEDITVLLKKYYLGLHKPVVEIATDNKRASLEKKRKDNRQANAFKNRKIASDMSPYITPEVKRSKMLPPQPKEEVPNQRLEMLKKWKLEKEKRKLEDLKNKKPTFKVSHVPVTVGLPNLENVNKEIKGKPFKLAPPNHRFRPPANIKPIHFNKSKEEESLKNRQIMTRSRTKNLKKDDEKVLPKRTDQKSDETRGARQKTPVKSTPKPLKSSTPAPVTVQTSPVTDVRTPTNLETPMYVSPFVTISRGKDNSRREYEARRSGRSFKGQTDAASASSPKAGAAYFSWILNNQISRLNSLCDKWNKYKEEENPSEEAISMIDVAIGQTNLLITKKFEQFRGLIDKCKNSNSETPVTCEDLHGFWDMLNLEVINLDKRFEYLEQLKTNHWEEILPEVKKKVVKKRGRPLKTAQASSSLKDAIKAARLKKMGLPVEKNPEEVKTPSRRSTRVSAVKSEKSSVKRSPGLMMMRATQTAKTAQTPGKSILKMDGSKSAKSHSKSVLFSDELENLENDLNLTNMKKADTPRKSTRVTRSKLF